MAETNRDISLKARIESLIKQFKKKTDKEMIYTIAGVCGISHRTASEHYYAYQAQKALLKDGFKEKHIHDWSSPFSTPGGLCKECRICGKTKFVKI